TGYPIIDVSMNGKSVKLEQHRYLLSSNSKVVRDSWTIPVHYSISGNDDKFMLLDKDKTGFDIGSGRYIKLNRMQKCPYRVSYPDDIIEALGKRIRAGSMDYMDAWGIESDMFALARSSRIKAESYLDFIEGYCLNGKYPLDHSVSDHLNGLSVLLSSNKALSDRIKKLIIAYHSRLFKDLGWKEPANERNVSTLLRSKVIASLGMNGYRQVIGRAQEMFRHYVKTGEQLPKNIRGAVYMINAWNGSRGTYNKFIQLYKKETDPENKRRLLIAASNFRDPKIIKDALKFSLSKDVRPQDAFIPSAIVSGNEVGKGIIWDWLKPNWKELMKRYRGGTHMLKSFAGYLGTIDDPMTKSDIKRFFSKKANMRNDMQRTLKQALEAIDANIKLKEFNGN
ncbi:MAG: ERAP1-like C-terminal domain-containing protein, partial [Candidatus Micrarchaeaceae archaeon]